MIELPVTAGQRVEEGDVVARLDDHLQAFAVERAQLSVEDAQAQAERYQTLVSSNTVSSVQLSDAQSELVKARLDLSEAEDALRRRLIVAPFAGDIGLIDIGVGDTVSTTNAVTTLDDRKSLLIDFRDAVSTESRKLPETADTPVVVKANDDDDPIMRLAVTTDGLPIETLTQIVENQIVDRLSAVPRVASVSIYGDRQPVFKIDLDMMSLASRGISPADVEDAIVRVTGQTTAGSLASGNSEILCQNRYEC